MARSHFNWYSVNWILWLAWFLAVEFYAVATNPSNTLSDNVWTLESLNFRQPFDFGMWTSTHWAVALVIWLLFAWLSLHFPFGLLR